MTTKRRKFITLLLLAVIGGVIAYALLNQNDEQLVFEGRPLSEWHALASGVGGDWKASEAGERALYKIGTNALPDYLKWMQHESPAWRWNVRRRFRGGGTVDRWLEGEGERRAEYAMSGFNGLGAEAAGTIPELEVMMKNPTNTVSAWRACLALSYIGEPAIPVLRAGYAGANPSVRANIGTMLRLTSPFQGKRLCLPIVQDALNHDDPGVRSAATNLVLLIAPEALTNAPAK